MEKRKIIKKNEFKPKPESDPKSDPKLPLTLYFFNKPLLYKTFESIAEEKGIPVRKLIISFASLGLKAYLSQLGQVFKDEEEVPVFNKRLAEEPIDSPYWYDSLGEEYKWIEGHGWIITNETIGPYRIRNICKIVETVKVDKERVPNGKVPENWWEYEIEVP